MKADTPTETLCHPFFDPLSKYRRMLPTDQFSSHERWRRRLLAWRNSGIRRYLEQNPDASLHKEDIDWGEPPMTNKLIESVRMRERQEQSKVLGSITLEKADVQQWRAAASSDGREANTPALLWVDAAELESDEAFRVEMDEGREQAIFYGHGMTPDSPEAMQWITAPDQEDASDPTWKFHAERLDALNGRLWVAFLLEEYDLRALLPLVSDNTPDDESFDNDTVNAAVGKAVRYEWQWTENTVQAIMQDQSLDDQQAKNRRARLTRWWASLPVLGGQGRTRMEVPLTKVKKIGYDPAPAWTRVILVQGPSIS